MFFHQINNLSLESIFREYFKKSLELCVCACASVYVCKCVKIAWREGERKECINHILNVFCFTTKL